MKSPVEHYVLEVPGMDEINAIFERTMKQNGICFFIMRDGDAASVSWAEYLAETSKNPGIQRIGLDKIVTHDGRNAEVSTVLLTAGKVDAAFETMVFYDDGEESVVDRYSTAQAAREGHQLTIDLLVNLPKGTNRKRKSG